MINYDDKEDHFIWQKFQAGSKEAYAHIFRNHYSALYNYGFKITKDQALTQDSLQDFFLYLFERKERLRIVTNIQSYLFLSFRRYLFRGIQSTNSKRNKAKVVHKDHSDILFDDGDLLTNQESAPVNLQLKERLNKLSWSQREAIYLKYYNNLPIEEIAHIMNMNYQSVANTLYRALKKIRTDEEFRRIFIRSRIS